MNKFFLTRFASEKACKDRMVMDEATESANKLPNRKAAVRPKTRNGPGTLPPPLIYLLQISSKNEYNLSFYHEKTIEQFSQCTGTQCSGIRNEIVQLFKMFRFTCGRKETWVRLGFR